MGIHEKPLQFDDDDPIPDQFVLKFVEIWMRHRLAPDDLAKAMLCASINMLIADGEPRDVAELLFGLAVQISPLEAVGHG